MRDNDKIMKEKPQPMQNSFTNHRAGRTNVRICKAHSDKEIKKMYKESRESICSQQFFKWKINPTSQEDSSFFFKLNYLPLTHCKIHFIKSSHKQNKIHQNYTSR